MDAPVQITPTKLADYLDVLSKAVFESGMNWKVIENKWPGFREAFDGFHTAKVASYTPEDVDRLLSDARIIRNGRKVEATTPHAGAILPSGRRATAPAPGRPF